MNITSLPLILCPPLAVALLAGTAGHARADAVTDWNVLAGEFLVEAKLGPPPANRVMAIVQTAVLEAIDGREPAATDAAVAAANRVTLARLLPAQEAAIAAAYRTALAKIADSPAKAAGIVAGETAAAAVLASRADDGAGAPDRYRPRTTPGNYVPTSPMAAPQWPLRKPWLMRDAAQFRPGPPPALSSAQWARDYLEVRTLGGRNSQARSAEQTELARFWEFSQPPIYNAVLRSVAQQPGRDPARNARLFAAAAQAMDDALIAVLDAKYHYHFWRPTTAIRNADLDGNDATSPEAGWVAMLDVPLHPEYPSAHSILAGALGAVLKAEIGNAPSPELSTASPSAKGAVRRWASPDDLVREVADARVFAGLHYRFSTETGAAMGRQIGALAAATLLPDRVSAAPRAPEALAQAR